MPFETSFAPLAKATAMVRRRRAKIMAYRSAATLRAAARVARALLPRLDDGEHPLVRWVRELRHAVGTDLVRLVAREHVSLFVQECLGRAEVDRAMAFEDAAGRLLELVTAHGDGEERRALDVLPVRLLQHLEPVERGPLQLGQELLLRQRADQALAPQLRIDFEVRRDARLADDVADQEPPVVLQ